MVESPGEMLYVPLYDATPHPIMSSKLGHIDAPLTAKIDIDDVFGGRRTCLLDYITYVTQDGAGDVDHVAYLDKKGIRSTANGWVCGYYRKCKVVDISRLERCAVGDVGGGEDPMFISDLARGDSHDRVFPNVLPGHGDDEDYIDGDDYDAGSDNWDVSYESEPDPDQLPTESKSWRKQFHAKEEDRMDMAKTASRRIDKKNYVVFVIKTENQVSTIWKQRDKRKYMPSQLAAQRKLVEMGREGTRLLFCATGYAVLAIFFEKRPQKHGITRFPEFPVVQTPKSPRS